jgi:hypothetical protein
MACSPGFEIVKVETPVSAHGDLADFLQLDAEKQVTAKLSVQFKPDFIDFDQASVNQSHVFTVRQKGSWCFEVFKDGRLVFSSTGTVAEGAIIRGSLNAALDELTLTVDDADVAGQRISVVLKRGSDNFGVLRHILDGSLNAGTDEVFQLVTDWSAHLIGQGGRTMDLVASKVNGNVELQVCQFKGTPTICPPCNRAVQDCDQIKKCQVSIDDTKAPTHNRTAFIKLDAAWRTCNNRSNDQKSNDFWITLLSIQECTSKNLQNCPRQIVDFSGLVMNGGSPLGIPSAASPIVTLEGRLPVLGTGNSTNVRITIELLHDVVSVSIQLNRNDGSWQWVPASKGHVMVFTIKVYGEMTVTMLPKPAVESLTKVVQFEITDHVRLPTPFKPTFLQTFVIRTKLTLDFPMEAADGQAIVFKKQEIQNNAATLLFLEFNFFHFQNGVLNYGPFTGQLSFKQLTPAQAAASSAAIAAGRDPSDSSMVMESAAIDNERAASPASSLASWLF